jgi:two-component system chemotaxis response regulator CheY
MTKILIADDSAFARLNCKKVLTKGGHDVVEAANGLEAVALFQSERPDVVFLDITMPGMDGLAALEEILKIDAQAPIAMASAMGQQSVVMQALKAGAKDILVKPFERERVLKTLDKLLV